MQGGSHLGFLIKMILAVFDLQVTSILPTKFRVDWPFGSGEVQIRFSRWGPWWPSWISDLNYFCYFWSTSYLDNSFQDSTNWLFCSEEVPNTLSRWFRWRPYWVSDRNDISYFWSTSHTNTSCLVLSQLAFHFRRRIKFKIDFQNGSHGAHPGYLIGMMLAIFYQQVSPIPPTKFWVNWWANGSGKGSKQIFKMAAILDLRSEWCWSFFIYRCPRYIYFQVSSQLVFSFRRKVQNRFSRWWLLQPSWIFDKNDFNFFLIYKSLWCTRWVTWNVKPFFLGIFYIYSFLEWHLLLLWLMLQGLALWFFFSRENNAWHFMWIVHITEHITILSLSLNTGTPNSLPYLS